MNGFAGTGDFCEGKVETISKMQWAKFGQWLTKISEICENGIFSYFQW